MKQQVQASARRSVVYPFFGVGLPRQLGAANEPFRDVIGGAEHDIDLAAVGLPTCAAATFPECLRRVADTLEELVAEFVNVSDRQRVTAVPEEGPRPPPFRGGAGPA